ncbi:hypothetical protein Hanom_Chr13g01208191 [Helianthus anomalus]
MWTNPVARITPAAKALAAKKRLVSVLRNRRFLPINGMATPIMPAIRIAAIATNLRMRAAFSSRHDSKSGESLQLSLDMDSERFLRNEPFRQTYKT